MDSALTLMINGSHSLYLDGVAWFATRTLTWTPFLLTLLYVLFRSHSNKEFWTSLGILLLCVLICDQSSSALFKPWIARLRPSHNPYAAHLVDLVHSYRGGPYGFFSSHAANTTAVSLFCALLFRSRCATLPLVAWTLLNCWTRLYLGVHYLGDILAGIACGLLVGGAAYWLARRLRLFAPRHYPPQRLQLIALSFLLTLCFICVPWQHHF